MLSWISVVVLLPLAWLATAPLVAAQSAAVVSARAPASAPWDETLAAFTAADLRHAPQPGGVLFVGSSSIRLWDDLETQFSAMPVVIKRGFGGSKLSDCVHYLDRLVIAYRPRMVLIYAGHNDLAEGKTAEQVLQQFRAFVEGIRQALPATRIAFVSIKPSPARASLLSEIRRTNTLVSQYAAAMTNVDFIDIFTPMLAADGKPRRELFRTDALHLNATGYALWRSVIEPY